MKPIPQIGMKRFSAQYHREAIDAHERAAEHHKSMARNHKAQLKAISKEIYAASVSPAIRIWKNQDKP